MRAELPRTEEPVDSTSESETTRQLHVERHFCECGEMESSFENAGVSEGSSGIVGTLSIYCWG